MRATAEAQRNPAASPTAILVQGMHASATVPLSRLVSLLTQRRPGDPAEADDDPVPHPIQKQAVADLNGRILRELGSSWSRPGVFFLRGKGIEESAAPIREAIRATHLQSAVAIIRRGSGGAGPVIFEDPALCLLPDLWDAALEELARSARVVHIFRNPLEVAASLKQSHGLPQPRTLQLWVLYNLTGLAAPGRRHALVVPHTDLVNPDSGLDSRLSECLDLTPSTLSEEDVRPRWKSLVESATHEPAIPGHVVLRSPLVPSIVKRLWSLLTEWEMRTDDQRAAELIALRTSFDDQSLFAGNLTAVAQPVPPAQVTQARMTQYGTPELSAPVEATGTEGGRPLLIHYHLFKNAGTSVDAILHRNFGDRWVNTEFPAPARSDHQALIRQFIRDNPDLGAISSHTLTLPVPRMDGIQCFPILFVRHPLDRLKSAYDFERLQDAPGIGPRMARELDFAGYIRARLANPGDRSCRDFQVFRLAMALAKTEGSERERALAAVERLPFIGLVEAFKASAQRLEQCVRPIFPDFRCFDVRANVTAKRRDTLEMRLDEIHRELGEECFAQVMAANQADMALYERVREFYVQGAAATPAFQTT